MATRTRAKARTKAKPKARPRARAVTRASVGKSARRGFRPVRKQPETLRLRSASPVLTVNDLPKSVAWYRDVLGLIVRDRWEQGGKLLGVEMLGGNVTFMLTQDDWKKGRDRVKGEGCRVLCTTAQDVDALAARIRERGGTVEGPRDEEGSRYLAVADPDGFKISIASAPRK